MKISRAFELHNAIIWVPWAWVGLGALAFVGALIALATGWEKRLYGEP